MHHDPQKKQINSLSTNELKIIRIVYETIQSQTFCAALQLYAKLHLKETWMVNPKLAASFHILMKNSLDIAGISF